MIYLSICRSATPDGAHLQQSAGELHRRRVDCAGAWLRDHQQTLPMLAQHAHLSQSVVQRWRLRQRCPLAFQESRGDWPDYDQLGKFTNLLLSYIHPNLQDCQLNLQNLIKLELEFDEDYKISPSKFSYKKLRRKRKSLRKRL